MLGNDLFVKLAQDALEFLRGHPDFILADAEDCDYFRKLYKAAAKKPARAPAQAEMRPARPLPEQGRSTPAQEPAQKQERSEPAHAEPATTAHNPPVAAAPQAHAESIAAASSPQGSQTRPSAPATSQASAEPAHAEPAKAAHNPAAPQAHAERIAAAPSLQARPSASPPAQVAAEPAHAEPAMAAHNPPAAAAPQTHAERIAAASSLQARPLAPAPAQAAAEPADTGRTVEPIVSFARWKAILERAAPSVRWIQEIPSDALAKKIASHWKTKNLTAPITLLSYQEVPEQKALLEQIAKALDVCFGPARLVSAETVEKEKQWEAFLSVPELKLVIACDFTLWQLPGLRQFYKEIPAAKTRQLGSKQLLLLPDLSLYLKDPLLKRSLWKALCQISSPLSSSTKT